MAESMEADCNTRMRVSVNPHSRSPLPICFSAMAKIAATALESIVRDNMNRLLKRHYEGKPGKMARLNPNVNLRGIQDFLKGGTCYLTSLQPWADALHVKPYHLLIKDLDVDEPQVLVSAKRMKQIEKLREELIEESK